MNFNLNWLWQGIAANGLYALLILAAGILLGALRAKGSRWLGPAAYALGGCAMAAVLLAAIGVLIWLPKSQSPTTPENVESNIRTWLDHFGISSTRVDDPECYFALSATLTNGNPLAIGRVKKMDRYITLQSRLTLSPEHGAMFEKLSKKAQRQFIDQIGAEMARTKVGYDMHFSGSSGTLDLTRRVPITAGLSEDIFIDNVTEIDNAIIDARATTRLWLSRLSEGANAY